MERDGNRLISRRHLLRHSAAGFGSLALAGLLAEEAAAAERQGSNPGSLRSSSSERSWQDPLAPKSGHFPARAKRIVSVRTCATR